MTPPARTRQSAAEVLKDKSRGSGRSLSPQAVSFLTIKLQVNHSGVTLDTASRTGASESIIGLKEPCREGRDPSAGLTGYQECWEQVAYLARRLELSSPPAPQDPRPPALRWFVSGHDFSRAVNFNKSRHPDVFLEHRREPEAREQLQAAATNQIPLERGRPEEEQEEASETGSMQPR